MQAELHDKMCRFERGDDPGAIVLRAGAYIPGIDVAAHHYDFFRLFRAANFTNHVGGIGIGKHVAFHFQMDLDDVAGIRQALDQMWHLRW